jgi:hypothetical protein
MPFKGNNCDEHIGKVAARILKEPPGCKGAALKWTVPKVR